MRSVAEILAEIEKVPRSHRDRVQRVFLADGDALVYPQAGLREILAALQRAFPALNRVGAYASPNSLGTKSAADLQQLRENRLRILYFGLESGDDATLAAVKKGFSAGEMEERCRPAQAAGMKLSVTAILGLAGRERSREHARATAAWVNRVAPEYFSLLTLFHRHNDDFFRAVTPLTRGGILEETLELVRHLAPRRTILRSNHVSNFLELAGSYPKDRDKIIAEVAMALASARRDPDWYDEIPDYREERF